MRQLAFEAAYFLVVLGLLLAAKLVLVVVAVAECAAMVAVCFFSVGWCRQYDRAAFLLLTVLALFLAGAQWSLWQYAWLRLARRGGFWRAAGEYFAITLRYPVVRLPHRWE